MRRLLKSCATPPVSCPTELHLLTLMELLFHQTARLQGVLVFGDIPEEDREALAGWERIDRVPGLGTWTEHFEEGRTLL